MTVWIYVDTSKQVGDRDHLNVFADSDAAERRSTGNDPEGRPSRIQSSASAHKIVLWEPDRRALLALAGPWRDT